jgi:hypothetical protein
MTDKEVMQQALEALEGVYLSLQLPDLLKVVGPITALREALAQPEQGPTCPECKAAVLYECVACSSNNYPPKPQPEPVACVIDGDLYFHHEIDWEDLAYQGHGVELLYTTPPAAQRPWQGLTEDEILEAAQIDGADTWLFATAYAIETKLKERNT